MSNMKRFASVKAPFGIALLAIVAQGSTSVALASEAPVFEWVLNGSDITNGVLKPTHGNLTAKLSPQAKLIGQPATAIRFDGKQSSVICDDPLAISKLPKRDVSVEAWIAVAKSTKWGGAFTAIQDNGSYERGILLGYQDDFFCFGVAGESTKRLTYMTAPDRFEPGRWYHIVGTYDGTTMRLYVDGKMVVASKDQKGDIAYPPQGAVAIGVYKDDNEFYPITGAMHRVAIFDRALSAADVVKRFKMPRPNLPLVKAKVVVSDDAVAEEIDFAGPWVRMLSETSAAIEWRTDQQQASVIEYGQADGESRRVADHAKTTDHRVALENLDRRTIYEYNIVTRADGDERSSATYSFDTHYGYDVLADRQTPSSPFPPSKLNEQIAAFAQHVVEASDADRGICLIVGSGEGRLAYELAKLTDWQIVGVEPDAAKVARSRALIDKTGLYGRRITIHHGDLNELKYGPYFANVVTSENVLTAAKPVGNFSDLLRLVRPAGGMMILRSLHGEGGAINHAGFTGWLTEEARVHGEVTFGDDDGSATMRFARAALPGSNEWTHQYGHADNTSNSKDNIVHGDMGILWWGRPGARPMPDRGPRNPAPVSSNGRLYIQGNRVLFGVDAYNGTVLWTIQAPEIRRANMIRDCTNMVAAPDALYLTSHQWCYKLDGPTGKIARQLTIPNAKDGGPQHWGYLAILGDQMIASATQKGAGYLGNKGEWYEHDKADQVDKVLSNAIHSMDRNTGSVQWSHAKHPIVNSTITISDGTIYFVEVLNAPATNVARGRLAGNLPKTCELVALDQATGAEQWRIPYDFSACRFMLYLSAADGVVTVMGSNKQKAFEVFAFAGDTGAPLWQRTEADRKKHHSGHLAHPAIVKDKIFVNRMILDLKTGAILKDNLPDRRGCGTLAASNNALYFRHHYQSMWDLRSDERTEFMGIRSGCWLGMIPSGGVLLAPETSAGCSCTHALQTSVGYVPRAAIAPANR